MLTLLVGLASAGSGPWILSPRDASVYVGTEYQRIGHLATENGSFADDVMTVDDGIATFGVQAYAGYGLVPRVQLALGVPWYLVQANREDGALCTGLGLEACKRTSGIGIITLRAQGLLLDEFYGAPLSLAIGGEFRQGEHTSKNRARITALGEGTSDLGGYLSVGHTGAFGNAGSWSAYGEVGGRYRFPNIADEPVPGSEFTGDAEVLIGVSRVLTFGGTVTSLWRPQGVDISAVDASDLDRFGSLRVLNVRPGVKVLLRSSENVVFSASVLGTLYAQNNPTDVITVSAGASVYLPGARE